MKRACWICSIRRGLRLNMLVATFFKPFQAMDAFKMQ